VATFERSTGPARINRLDRTRQVTVLANLSPGISQGGALDAIGETVAKLKMGPEYKVALAGESKEMRKAFAAYIIVFVTAFLFIYLVLAAQFESWLHPITIFDFAAADTAFRAVLADPVRTVVEHSEFARHPRAVCGGEKERHIAD